MSTRIGFAVGLAVAIVATLLFCMREPPQASADCSAPPAARVPDSRQVWGLENPHCNGDVNGDGMVNIADVTSLCGYLFLGTTPEPRTIYYRVAATGHTRCYNAFGAEIDCAGADFPGQDGFYQAGCPKEGRFADNLDGTVTDNCTGLMWQKETADVSGSGSMDYEDLVDWESALKYCENTAFAGQTDWRLPNVRELQSIVDYGRLDPAVDPVFGTLSDWYWSSSTCAGSTFPVFAWGIGFDDGNVGGSYGAAGGHGWVRAVRNAR